MRPLSPWVALGWWITPDVSGLVKVRCVLLALVELFGQFLDAIQRGRICALRIGEVFAFELPTYPAVKGEYRHQVKVCQLAGELICRSQEGAGGVESAGVSGRTLGSAREGRGNDDFLLRGALLPGSCKC